MSAENIVYPPLDPNVQQQFAISRTKAIDAVTSMHAIVGTSPLPEGEWSTPSYQSFSNNDVLGSAPLQNMPKGEDPIMGGYRTDANGQLQKVARFGTKNVDGEEFTRVLSPNGLLSFHDPDGNDGALLVRTADLDAGLVAKRAETADRRAQKAREAKPIGAALLTEITRASISSTTELLEKYNPDFHKVQSRSVILKDMQSATPSKKVSYNLPKRYLKR